MTKKIGTHILSVPKLLKKPYNFQNMFSTPMTTKKTASFATPLHMTQEELGEREILNQVSHMTLEQKTPMRTPIMVRKQRSSCETTPRLNERQPTNKLRSTFIDQRMRTDPPMIPADLENPSNNTNPFKTIQSHFTSFTSPPDNGCVSEVNLNFISRLQDSSRESNDMNLTMAMRCNMAREVPNLESSPVQARALKMRRPRYDIVFHG